MSLSDIVKSIFGASYYEVAQDTPFLVTPTTVSLSILPGTSYKWVLSYLIKVRSMGTATYIGVGNAENQGFRLTSIGDAYGFSGNPGEVCDLTKVFVNSDTNDAVIEVTALFKPMPMQGVILAQRY